MGIHHQPSSMLKESLPEYLQAATFCVFKSNETKVYYPSDSNSCMGYPAALLLFSIVDTIGSYFRKSINLAFDIEGKKHYNVDGKYQNFYILNSDYFKFDLPMDFIKVLYNNFRSELSHNSLLGKNTSMFANNLALNLSNNLNFHNTPFVKWKDKNGETHYSISIYEFYYSCNEAVRKFYDDIDEIVPNSVTGKKFH